VIDSYSHCGTEKFEPLEQVLEAMDGAGVDRAVLVQHLGQFDNSYIEGVVASDPDRFIGVGLVDVASPNWKSDLKKLSDSKSFCGVRFPADALEENPEAPLVAAELGLNLVLYFADGLSGKLRDLRDLVCSVGGRTVVVTHLGCPQIDREGNINSENVLALAEYENVVVTLSGQGMFCAYPHLLLLDFVRSVVEKFTANRVMWGSNFPVCGDRDAYALDLELVSSDSLGFDQSQITQITESTARRVMFENR